jgi:hypothetical protein
MSIALLLAIILFLVIIAALWYTPPAPYGLAGKFVGAIAALVLFLVAIGVMHL